jgi:hypothetical protein
MDDAERDRLVAWLVAEFEVQNGIDVTNDTNAIARLRQEIPKLEHVTDTYEVNLPFLAADQTGPKHLHVVLAKKRIDDIREGREGPPHVDRGRRSAPPPPPSERRTSDSPKKESSPAALVIALVLVVAAVASFFAYEETSSKHHEHDHDGHGQEHKH